MLQSKRIGLYRWTRWGARARTLVVGVLVVTFVGFGSIAWGLQYDQPLDLSDDADDGTALGTAISEVALGSYSVATGEVSTATGYHSQSTGFNSAAYGARSSASGDYSSAYGVYSSASGEDSVAVGNNSTASGSSSSAYGVLSSASGKNSTATGYASYASGANSTALGQGAYVSSSATGSVALGQGSVANEANTVSVGTSSYHRRIVNVADGIADSDAATVGQMKAADTTLQTNINNETTARAEADAAMQADIGALQDQALGTSWTAGSNDVAASASGSGSTALGSGASARTRDTAIGSNATVSADGSVALGADTTVASENSVAVGADSSVAAGAAGGVALGQNASVTTGATGSVAIGQDSVADEADTVSVGSSGNERRVTNVADGVNATDAVNVQQLQQFSASTSGAINRLDSRIDNLSRDAFSGIAAVAAIAGIPAPAQGKRTSLGIGYGNYKGENAIAVGFKSDITDNIRITTAIAHSNSDVTTSAGVGWSW